MAENNEAAEDDNNIRITTQSIIVLQCIDAIQTADQTQNIIEWEKTFRNTLLRKNLPDTSLICMYPVDDNTKALKGQSLLYSPWMKELIDIYDGVIYANANWQGVAYDFIDN
jgi:hypothetical protein